jgi:site-specific DNA recombinase
MSTTVTTDTAVEADAPVLLAVSYLRVSTREQAERGGTEEGFSIPAQREANARKADELGRGSCASSWTRGVGAVGGS